MSTKKQDQEQTRAEKMLYTQIKNMRVSMNDFSMEKFVKWNLETLMKIDREEYLDEHSSDKANGYYNRGFRSLLKNGIRVNIPRTRSKSSVFAPVALELARYTKEQVDELCMVLYTKGMSGNDISEVMQTFFGNTMSRETINNLADKFHDIRLAWFNSTLDTAYKVIFADATHITVRRGDSYQQEPVYIMYGVKENNTREILYIGNTPQENLDGWNEALQNIKSRGVEYVDLFVTDGLKGLKQLIKQHYKEAKTQDCVVHKMRNVAKDVRVKDRRIIMEDLKEVFNNFTESSTIELANQKLDKFLDKYKTAYPRLANKFDQETRTNLFEYINYHPEVRRMIYTTNSIENLNRQIKKATKQKLSFESVDKMLDYIFVVTKQFEEKNWNIYPVHNFTYINFPEEIIQLLNEKDMNRGEKVML